MYKKVMQYIEKFQMIQKEESVIVGISGGADSVCLFYVLLQYMKDLHGAEFGKYLKGVHVHHGIRGLEAKRDMDFVQTLLDREGVTCYVHEYDVPAYAKEQGLTVEEAGRILRYETFRHVAEEIKREQKGNVKIAVAHNENDNAETILHNLCRGTGLKGMRGILPVNDEIIRPLLCISRTEIEAYLQERGIDYQTDATNLETEYTRNRLRLEILPMLTEQVNTHTIAHIVSAGEDAGAAEQFLERVTLEHYRTVVTEDKERIFVDIQKIKALDSYLAKRILRLCMERICGSLKDVTRTHIETLFLLLDKQSGKSLQLQRDIKAMISYDKLILGREQLQTDVQPQCEELEIKIPGTYTFGIEPLQFEFSELFFDEEAEVIKFLENNIKNEENFYTKHFDCDKMKFMLRLRYRKAGDLFSIGSTLKHKKLKSYFIDEKIPKEQRSYIPLLTDGNHILWIVGHRISEAYKVTKDTRHILKVTVKYGE